MNVENKTPLNSNNKYLSLTELKETISSNVGNLDVEKKEFELFSKISGYLGEIKVFEWKEYKRWETKNKTSDIYQNILSKINLEELMSFSINKWILVLNYRNWEKEYKNLIFSEEKGQEYINELKNTWKIAVQNLDELGNQINKEKLFWWAVLVSYCAIAKTWNFFVDKITIRLSDWVTKVINFTDWWVNHWTKEILKSNLFKILEKEWILFNPKEFSFYKIEDTKIWVDIGEELTKINYEKYKKLCESNWEKVLSKKEFELRKEKISNELNKNEIKFSNYKKFQELFWKYWFGPVIQHALFLPIFFKTYHSQTSDLASLWKSLSEWWLFEAWANGWLALSKLIPVKNPLLIAGLAISFSLIWGAWSIILWEEIWKKIELDKKFWKVFPEREDYWEKEWLWKWKSFLAHFATLWPVNWLVDKFWTDFKIPWTPISFIETSVNIDTDIKWYMSSDVWRDKEFWNKRVWEYPNKLTDDIIWLYEDYKKNNYYPSKIDSYERIKKTPEQKLDELKKSLSSKLNIWTWRNEKIKEAIYYWIIWLIESWKFNINKKTIWEIVSNNISYLKIDENYIGKKERDLFLQDFLIKTFLWENNDIKGNLNYQKRAFEAENKNPLKWLKKEEIDFCRKIYQRIVNHEKMIWPDIFLWDMPFNHSLTKNQYIKPWLWLMEKWKEKLMFEKLIEDDNFLLFLNTMVEYKRDKDFLTNIKKTWYAVEWNLV